MSETADNARRRKKKLVGKTDAALEALGEGRGASTTNQTQPQPAATAAHVERRSAKDTRRAETTRALAAQLKARLLAAEKVGNVAMATDTRKKLAALLTQRL